MLNLGETKVGATVRFQVNKGMPIISGKFLGAGAYSGPTGTLNLYCLIGLDEGFYAPQSAGGGFISTMVIHPDLVWEDK